MEERCIWFHVWTRNIFLENWYETAKFRSFAAARRFADRVLDMYPKLQPEFKFERCVYFNGSIVEREFIA